MRAATELKALYQLQLQVQMCPSKYGLSTCVAAVFNLKKERAFLLFSQGHTSVSYSPFGKWDFVPTVQAAPPPHPVPPFPECSKTPWKFR